MRRSLIESGRIGLAIAAASALASCGGVNHQTIPQETWWGYDGVNKVSGQIDTGNKKHWKARMFLAGAPDYTLSGSRTKDIVIVAGEAARWFYPDHFILQGKSGDEETIFVQGRSNRHNVLVYGARLNLEGDSNKWTGKLVVENSPDATISGGTDGKTWNVTLANSGEEKKADCNYSGYGSPSQDQQIAVGMACYNSGKI